MGEGKEDSRCKGLGLRSAREGTVLVNCGSKHCG